MLLLVGFAFLAGLVTILSPCILPVLPIILSSSVGGKDTGKARPFGVVIGFIASFTFFTLFLSAIVQVTGVSADALRLFAVFVVAGFGISLLIPKLQEKMESLFSRLANLVPQGNTSSGFLPGVLVGLSLGLLWTPCVGPILASVISLAITGSVTLETFLITFAFSIGTALPMFLIMWGGQALLRRVPWLLANTARIQRAFGVVMVLTAFGIFFNIDRRFQSWILDTFPQYGANLSTFEDNAFVRQELNTLNGQIDNEFEGVDSTK